MTRQEIWIRAWLAVAGCWNTKHKDTCADWADECLKQHDKRFPQPLETQDERNN